MEEIWKPLPEFEKTHEVSNLGKVRSLDRIDSKNRLRKGKILSIRKNNRGYCQVHISANGKTYDMLLHRLIAMAFVDNPDGLPQVNHKDENKDNNQADNLEWCTNLYNRHYGTGIERMAKNHNYKDCIPKGAAKRTLGKIVQCDENGNFIKEWSCICEACLALKCGWTIVKGCCDGKYKQSHGFTWKWATDYITR